MLIFTYRLEKYIKNNILPKILLVPNNYIIKGSFRRRIPYVTDVDIVNTVHPDINRSNIYEHIMKLIYSLLSNKNLPIKLIYVTCGTDDRFKIQTGSDMELKKIKLLLSEDEISTLNSIIEKYPDDTDRKLFYINELIWPFYKLRWSIKQIMDNEFILKDGKKISFKETVENNDSLLLQYFVMIKSYPVGIDVIIQYEEKDNIEAYTMAADYNLKLANYSREFYFMIFPFKYYFRDNKKISLELEDLIEKKLGLYKQLLVRIDGYHLLYKTNNLNIKIATDIVNSIMNDTQKLPNFESNVISKIKEIATNNPPDIKMNKWDLLLEILYDEIIASVNIIAKEYFYKYLELVPENIKKKFYIKFLH